MDERTDTLNARDTSRDDRSLNDIERDIEETRREMSRTIDEIQYRLSPQHMKQVAKERMRTMAHDTSHTFMDRIKENPGAAAVAGLGLWMLFRGHSSHTHDWQSYANDSGDYDVYCNACGEYYIADINDRSFDTAGTSGRGIASRARGTVNETTSRAKERVSGVADSARDRLEDVGDRVQDSAGELADRARSARARMQWQARRAQRSAADAFHENPIILGAIGLAAGAALGALIPETRREHEMFGEASDRVLSQATSTAREKIDDAKQVAKTAADAAMREGKEEARRQNLAGGATSTTETQRDIGNRIV